MGHPLPNPATRKAKILLRRMNIKAGLGDEICADQLLPLWDRKADIAYGKTSCAAAISRIVRFVRLKRTREEPFQLIAL